MPWVRSIPTIIKQYYSRLYVLHIKLKYFFVKFWLSPLYSVFCHAKRIQIALAHPCIFFLGFNWSNTSVWFKQNIFPMTMYVKGYWQRRFLLFYFKELKKGWLIGRLLWYTLSFRCENFHDMNCCFSTTCDVTSREICLLNAKLGIDS